MYSKTHLKHAQNYTLETQCDSCEWMHCASCERSFCWLNKFNWLCPFWSLVRFTLEHCLDVWHSKCVSWSCKCFQWSNSYHYYGKCHLFLSTNSYIGDSGWKWWQWVWVTVCTVRVGGGGDIGWLWVTGSRCAEKKIRFHTFSKKKKKNTFPH
jgi:hypothetical protein